MALQIPVLMVVRFCGSEQTFVDPVDGDEEGLRRRHVVQVAESEAETVVTSEPSSYSSGVFVPQTVHLHVILREVLTRREFDPTRLSLQRKIRESFPLLTIICTNM